MLHDSFQAISSNNILHFNIPLHLLLKGRRKARSLTNQFSRMLCNTGSDWEKRKKTPLGVKSRNWHQESLRLWKKSTED